MRLTPTPYPPRILIVDDEQDMRDLLIDLIESGGFRAQAVADGTEMQRALAAGDHALLILDLRLRREEHFDHRAS